MARIKKSDKAEETSMEYEFNETNENQANEGDVLKMDEQENYENGTEDGNYEMENDGVTGNGTEENGLDSGEKVNEFDEFANEIRENETSQEEPSSFEVPEEIKEVVPEKPKRKRSTVPKEKASKQGKETKSEAPILTVDVNGEAETTESKEDILWHEIRNAYHTRKILSGTLGMIERLENGKTIAVAFYKGMRIIVPLSEMMINVSPTESGDDDSEERQGRILNNMIGADIDFVVKGIETKSKSAVGSRKDAMLRKRKVFYFDKDTSGKTKIYNGRTVEARIVAVSEKVVRVDVFGIERSISGRFLSWDWVGDARDKYNVGDKIVVRVSDVRGDSPENLRIVADIRSLTTNQSHEALKSCKPQTKCIGKITDIRKGVVFITLVNGANAIAHSCFDKRTPGKGDDVTFVVTRVDEERNVAVGMVSRILRQNL